MATKRKSPIEQIRTGKRGRPALVQSVARRAIADAILAALTEHGLSIVPTRLLSELAIFTGEPPPADDPSLPKPVKPDEHE